MLDTGRGFNIVLIEKDGTHKLFKFDIWASSKNVDDMIEFIDTIDLSNQIVLIAVKDEASKHMTAISYKKLQLIGVDSEITLNHRDSFAFIRLPDGRIV